MVYNGIRLVVDCSTSPRPRLVPRRTKTEELEADIMLEAVAITTAIALGMILGFMLDLVLNDASKALSEGV